MMTTIELLSRLPRLPRHDAHARRRRRRYAQLPADHAMRYCLFLMMIA